MYLEILDYQYQTTVGAYVPRWTQDSDACLDLQTEYGIHTIWEPTEVLAYGSDCWIPIVFSCHADKKTAFRYAVVQAVIEKLKA